VKIDRLVGIVGPCAAGKSTLVERLKALNIPAKNIAQEHSYVPEMWQVLTKPGLLIYLDVSYEIASQRRNLNWTEEEFERQLKRLDHARAHADLIIHTDELNKEQVLEAALKFINRGE
jgi:deoxyadenosine/deoxycytidine kinase